MLRALDLFCCAGGTTKGLQQAGYHVTGMDWTGFDLIWASPPCQRYARITPARTRQNHPDLLPTVLKRLRAQPTPYICENVAGTQHLMRSPLFLCGTMFGLNIWRHRWFEIGNVGGLFFLLPPCSHQGHPVLISGRGMRGVCKGGKRPAEPLKAVKEAAIEIDWMVTKELDEAIPPVYSHFLAEQIQRGFEKKAV